MSQAKFLVLGSNSFSGSHFIAEILRKGHIVHGLSRSNENKDVFLPYKWNKSKQYNNFQEYFTFHKIDINNDFKKLIELINEYKPEYVVNFAAQGMVAESWLNPTHWYKTNILSQVRFHDELRKLESLKKYIHVTTPEVYGSTNNAWISEDHRFDPTTPYAVSRAACDMHLKSFFKAYGFPVVFTRAANVYGPGQQLYRIIPRTLLSAKTGKKLELHGGGHSIRSFIHIKDVVSATLILCMEGEPGTTWHLSTKQSISIRELVNKICELNKIPFESIVNETKERLGKDQSYLLDSQAMRNKFGWKDNINLENGLDDTLNWVKLNFEYLKNLSWDYAHKS